MRSALILVLLVLMPGQLPAPAAITVSAAVSLTDALTAVAGEYANGGRGGVRFNFGASNVLARQVVNGAPVDLFISADEAQMDVVSRAGLIKDGSRVDLLSNQLAVVVPSDRPRTFGSINDLAGPSFRRIAIGDPAAVPAGIYARQYLEKEGVWEAVSARIVPTGSVRAALTAARGSSTPRRSCAPPRVPPKRSASSISSAARQPRVPSSAPASLSSRPRRDES